MRLLFLGLSACIVLSAACATGKPSADGGGREPSLVLLQVPPGPLALTSPREPASFEFDPGQGWLESAGEGAARATRAMLSTPNLLHPQVEAAAGAVEFVLTPFAAGYGALSASHRKLPAGKLAETEGELRQAMNSMAGQERLREALLERAGEKTRRRLIPMAPAGAAVPPLETASAVVETTIESLRLQRAGAGDGTYALRMKAQARVVRAADGAVVFDRPYEFRSQEALFIDWARSGGFESVAQTGYRELAEQMANDLFVAPAATPIRLGPAIAASAHRSGTVGSKEISRGKRARAGLRTSYANPGLAMNAGVPRSAFAALRVADNSSFEIDSRGGTSDLLIQSLPAREELNPDTITDTEWLLGGLENDRNAVVQAMAGFAAVPFGLWEQTVGLLRHRTSEEQELAERSLKLVARRMEPHHVLADYIAQSLAPQTSQPVVLVKDTPRTLEVNAPVFVPCSYRVMPAGFAHSEAGPAPLATHAVGTALEIRLVEVRLARTLSLSRRLALCVDAQVICIRKRDGQELYSFPVAYRSAGKSLNAWAEGNAEMFRRELSECCREMGTAAAEEIVSCGLVAPNPESRPVFAQK